MSLSDLMLPEFDREMQTTRRILACIPADKMNWQPHAGLHTIGWNANHLTDVVGWGGAIIEYPEFDMAPVDGPRYEGLNISDPAELLAVFDQNVAASRTALAAVSDARMAEPWSLKMAGQTLFTLSKGDCFRKWVLSHVVHHRAILSVYLRMAGVEHTPPFDA